MSTLLSVQNLSFYYQNKPALINLNFELQQGEILAFLGLNGAGKSTALNLISGILPIKQGQVTIKHYDLDKQAIQAKQCLGYLPEQPPLYPSMQVDAYLNFAGQIRGLTGKALCNAIDRVLECCDLIDVKQSKIKQLSQGFKQRVGIAQALIHQPDVIILDEPTVGLDPKQRQQTLDLIKTLAQKQAVIFSTHILSEVQQVASHVQILQQGHLRLQKTALNTQTQSHILLTLGNDLNTSQQQALLNLSGVQNIQAQSKQQWQIFYEDKPKVIADIISQWVVKNNLGLLGLQTAVNDLEQVFLQTIQAESL